MYNTPNDLYLSTSPSLFNQNKHSVCLKPIGNVIGVEELD